MALNDFGREDRVREGRAISQAFWLTIKVSLIFISIAAFMLMILLHFFGVLPFQSGKIPSEAAAQIVYQSGLVIASVIGGSVGLSLAFLRTESTRSNAITEKEKQVTQLYVDVLQLLAEKRSAMRVGALSVLERIVQVGNSTKDHKMVTSTLVAHIRDVAQKRKNPDSDDYVLPNEVLLCLNTLARILKQGRAEELIKLGHIVIDDHVDFSHSQLPGIELHSAKLSGVNFSDSRTEGFRFVSCELRTCDFTLAEITSGVFDTTNVFGCVFDRVAWKYLRIDGGKVNGSSFSTSSFQSVVFQAVEIHDSKFNGAKVESEVQCIEAELKNVVFSDSVFSSFVLGKTDFVFVSFNGCGIKRTIVNGGKWKNTTFSGGGLDSVEIGEKAEIDDCEFSFCETGSLTVKEDSILRNVVIDGCCSLTIFQSKLHTVSFSSNVSVLEVRKVSIEKARFVSLQGGGFDDVQFIDCDLHDTVFVGIKFESSPLRNSNLSKAKFINCDLGGASFRKSDLRGADFSSSRGLKLRNVIHASYVDDTTSFPRDLKMPWPAEYDGKEVHVHRIDKGRCVLGPEPEAPTVSYAKLKFLAETERGS